MFVYTILPLAGIHPLADIHPLKCSSAQISGVSLCSIIEISCTKYNYVVVEVK